jgi:hypothetical protein
MSLLPQKHIRRIMVAVVVAVAEAHPVESMTIMKTMMIKG